MGRTSVYFWGSLITGFSALPAFWIWMNYPDNPILVWAALIIPFAVFYASIYGPEAALFCDLFRPQVRYTGISFVYQFSGIFASGLTPIIATALMQSLWTERRLGDRILLRVCRHCERAVGPVDQPAGATAVAGRLWFRRRRSPDRSGRNH